MVLGHLAQVVAVVDRGDAHAVEFEHGLDVARAGFAGGLRQGRVLRRIGLRQAPALDAPARGQVAVDDVVRRGLVGHDVGADAAGPGPARQFRHDVGRIGAQADRHRFLAAGVLRDQGQRLVEAGGLLVQVARAQAEIDRALLALDVERAGAGKRGGQRLRPAHAAEPRRQHPAPGQAARVVLAPGFDKGLVGALHDALRADVDPAAGRHLAVHHEAGAVERVEVLPGRPFGHQVGVRDQHARRAGVGAEDADRLARLHQQRLVFLEPAQALQNAVKARPVARRLADAAVDHELIRVLRNLRVEVVLDHAVGRLDLPVGTSQRRAARCAHRARHTVGKG